MNQEPLVSERKSLNTKLRAFILLEELGLLAKRTRKTINNETKKQKGGFSPVLLETLAVSLLGSALIGRGVLRAGKETIRAGDLKLPHSLTNFEIKNIKMNLSLMYHMFLKHYQFLLLFTTRVVMNMGKYLSEKDQLKY